MSNHLPIDFDEFDFCPVVKYNGEWHIFDFTAGYKSAPDSKKTWGIGRFNEKRPGMYIGPQYKNGRDIHMGIDFWTPVGEPVYAFYEGEIAYFRDNARKADYGPTIVTKHSLEGTTLFALYGHLSRSSLKGITIGQQFEAGEQLGQVGSKQVNGGWEPHLHFQLSLEDPGEADMPGVVAEEDREQALQIYPDPRLVLGDLY
jgi:murein DD-endopeptidase MepM/ murein hydrolase activator NlpD